MKQEIQDIIRKNLPAEVGDVLRQELSELARLREETSKLAEEGKSWRNDACAAKNALEAATKRLGNIEKREADAAAKDVTLTLREELVKLREAHAKERVDEMRGVVKDVFSNNRLKYSVPVAVPGTNGIKDHNGYVAGGAFPHVEQHTVEGEG